MRKVPYIVSRMFKTNLIRRRDMRKAKTRKHGQWLRLIVALFWAADSAESARADIYLNGASGNDGNDGLTSGTAVKTFATAKAKLAAQGTGSIKVTGQVTVSSDTVMSFSDTGDGVSIGWSEAMVQRDAGYSNALFYVNGGCALTLTNIVIDGNRYIIAATSPLIIAEKENSSLIIQEDTVLRNNHHVDCTWANSGGAICLAGAVCHMSGGSITNNTSDHEGGGGVYEHWYGLFEMTGGVIAGNDSSLGGGISVFAYQAFTNVLSGNAVICGNSAAFGGGGVYGSTVIMSGNAVVSNNFTYGSVGGITARSLEMSGNSRVCCNETRSSYSGVSATDLVMKDNAVIENNIVTNTTGAVGSTYLRGGGATVSGSAVLRDSAVIRGNVSKYEGGGIYLFTGASLVMSNSAAIYGNKSLSSNGGGIYMASGTGWLSLNNGSVSSNKAGGAGGIYFAGTNVTRESRITGTMIEGNTTVATGAGGGCGVGAAASRLYFEGVRLAGNSAGNWGNRGGGAINVEAGSVVCSNCVFSGNSALGYGGAVNYYGTALSNSVFGCCVFTNNAAQTGGGICNLGCPLTVEDCVFADNAATSGNGGAIGEWVYLANDRSALNVRRCLFVNNTATNGNGGVLYFCSTSRLDHVVENCTMYGNVAKYGAAVYATDARLGETVLRFCTVSGNTNRNSSAAVVQAVSAPVSLSGTAVAYNYTGAAVADVSGTLKAADHCYFTQASNTVTITSAADNLYLGTSGDPKLADAPADNGGTPMPDGTRMLTLAFAKASPLRNRGGDTAGVGTDARGAGYPRLQESAADIGAFEYKPDSRGTLVRIE